MRPALTLAGLFLVTSGWLVGCGECGPSKLEPPTLGRSTVTDPFEVNGKTYTGGTVTVNEATVELEATDQDGNVWRVTWERTD